MYKDPLLHAIADLMNKYGPEKLKGRWSVGDSLAIPKGLLPHAFISYDSKAYFDVAAGEIRENSNIVISVAVDMTRELKVPTDRSDAHEMVVDFLTGLDAETLKLRSDCIVGVLRAHQDLDKPNNIYIEVGSETSVEYGIGLEKRGPGIVTAEGILRFQVTHDQMKP